MAFINSDGTEAVKDMGQLGIEADGSPAGVQAVSMKEGLGRRACRLGSGSTADSGAVPIAIGTAAPAQLCRTPAAGAGMRHHVTLISLQLLNGTPGTDWASFTISWSQDDGDCRHTVFVPAQRSVQLVLDGQICTARNGQVTISAQAGTAGASKALAGICTVVLPD
jgi:hypothetical protein